MMSRFWCCLALAALLLGASCAGIGRSAVKVPFGKRCLYAPIFVDRTEGQVAPQLYDALNQRLYRRAPGLFSFEYAESCVVVDGTVLSMTERSAGGVNEISIEIAALVEDKEGNQADLGVLSRSLKFRDNPVQRERAITQLCLTLADDLLDSIGAQKTTPIPLTR